MKSGTTSDALFCQIDLIASFANFFNQKLEPADAPDSQNLFDTFTGKSAKGREILVLQGGAFSLVRKNWKYIEATKGPKVEKLTNIESGKNDDPQLYDLQQDIGEKTNVATQHPEIVKELAAILEKIRADGRSR